MLFHCMECSFNRCTKKPLKESSILTKLLIFESSKLNGKNQSCICIILQLSDSWAFYVALFYGIAYNAIPKTSLNAARWVLLCVGAKVNKSLGVWVLFLEEFQLNFSPSWIQLERIQSTIYCESNLSRNDKID